MCDQYSRATKTFQTDVEGTFRGNVDNLPSALPIMFSGLTMLRIYNFLIVIFESLTFCGSILLFRFERSAAKIEEKGKPLRKSRVRLEVLSMVLTGTKLILAFMLAVSTISQTINIEELAQQASRRVRRLYFVYGYSQLATLRSEEPLCLLSRPSSPWARCTTA